MESSTRSAPPAPTSETEGRGRKPGDEPEHKERKSPNPILIVVFAIVVVVGLIFGIKTLIYNFGHESTDDAKVDADIVSVSSKTSERVARILVDTNQLVSRGQVIMLLDDSSEKSTLAAALANRQAQAAQAEAARTNVALTSATQQAQNEQGSGGIATAQSAIRDASAQAVSATRQEEAAQAAVNQALAQLRAEEAMVPSSTAALTKANEELFRTKTLVATGDESKQQLDEDRASQAQAQAQYRAAVANVHAAQTSVSQAQAKYSASIASAYAARAQIGTQQGQLTTAQGKLAESSVPYRVSAERAQYDAALAQVHALDAQVNTARVQLSYTVIRSPIDGIIGSKNVSVGTTVSPGEALFDIAPRETYITANFKETQLGKLCVGQDVEVTVDSYGGTDFHGKIAALSPASQGTFSLVPAQNSTGNFVKVTQRLPVRILIVDPPADKPLRVGMSVEAAVDLHSQCR